MIRRTLSVSLLALALCPQAAWCAAQAASAPVAAAPAVPGLGIANLEVVAANSNAFKAAQTQRASTFKAQLDQAEARRKQTVAQLQPMVDRFNKERAAPKPDQASLQQQMQAIQQVQGTAQQEMQTILQPVTASDAYVLEQINDKLPAATQAAIAKNRISVLLGPQNVLFAGQANNLNAAIIAELNAILPSVQLIPPAGWKPKAAAQPAG